MPDTLPPPLVCVVVVIRVWLVRRMTISFFGTFSRNLMLWSAGTDIIHPTDGAGYKVSLISGLVPDPRLPSGRSWWATQGFPLITLIYIIPLKVGFWTQTFNYFSTAYEKCLWAGCPAPTLDDEAAPHLVSKDSRVVPARFSVALLGAIHFIKRTRDYAIRLFQTLPE